MKKKIYNSEELQRIQNMLTVANANVKIPNEFVVCKAIGNNIEVSLAATGNLAMYLSKKDFGCFEWKDMFMGRFHFDTEELEIFTFAELHTHTEYSILDGANRIKDLSKKYEYHGAITDHGVMYGCVDFYKKMHDLHKHPIIGFEAYTDSWRATKSSKATNCTPEETEDLKVEEKKSKYHLILLAKNETGYKNLVKLCSYGAENVGGSFPQRPRITYDEIEKHSEGIIVLSACMGGELPQLILKGDMDGAREFVEYNQNLFGDDYYVEIQKHASKTRVDEMIDAMNFEMGSVFTYGQISDDYLKVKSGDMLKKDFNRKYSNKIYREIEICMQEADLNEELIDLAEDMGVKVVATNDAHYLNPEDADFHEALLCNQTGKKLNDPNHFSFAGTGYYVHSVEEMETIYENNPEFLINTLEVAEKCHYDFRFGEYQLPKFPIPAPFTDDKAYLRHLAEEGFKERFANVDSRERAERWDRLNFELEVIFKMGYQGYFFIVWDYIKWAKDHGIYVGPGRGSGAGSIVLYCLHITENLDPIKYGLLFERFLNPDRISMPDIDVDFEFELREDVIDYCKRKYGEKCVSRIITFGTMAAKGAVQDMARVLDKPVAFAQRISAQIPSAPGMTIKRAMVENAELSNMYVSDAEVKEVMDLAMKVEGLIRNTSCHACGVIIAPDDVTEFCPQSFSYDKDTDSYERTTQYTMGECEEIGLLKMDFLGLRTESVIKESVNDILKYYNLKLNHYDVDSIAMDDVNVYMMLAKGATAGVFQLESPGITKVIIDLFKDVEGKVAEIEQNAMLTEEEKEMEKKEFGKQCFERLIAGISLYRPGPMDFIGDYIRGKNDPSTIHYDCPQLKPILESTYGVIVYQEQVMQIVRALAGFTPGQADVIRKAMGKKKQDILDEYKPYFLYGSGNELDPHTGKPYGIVGCVANGISENIASGIWDKMESFAKYAFNKSHAAAYAVVAIQTAWLAYYYPAIFMKANLNVYKGNPDKLKFYLSYCGQYGIKVTVPSVNKSGSYFELNENATEIVFGLSGIKNVGKISTSIIKEREEHGSYTSLRNFIERMMKTSGINSRALKALALVGALDCFEGSRKSKFDYVDKMIEIVKSDKSIETPGQNTIFDIANEVGYTEDVTMLKDIFIPNSYEEYASDEALNYEEEYAGFFLTKHPLDDYKEILRDKNCKQISEFKMELENLIEVTGNSDSSMNISCAGILYDVTPRVDKNGNTYATFRIKDVSGDIGGIIWSNNYEKCNEIVKEGNKVLVTGNITSSKFGMQLAINSVSSLDALYHETKGLQVLAFVDEVAARKQYQEVVAFLSQKDKGDMQIKFYKSGKFYNLGSFKWSMELEDNLRNLCTEHNVRPLI